MSQIKAMKRISHCQKVELKDLELIKWPQTRSQRGYEGNRDVALPSKQRWGDMWLGNSFQNKSSDWNVLLRVKRLILYFTARWRTGEVRGVGHVLVCSESSVDESPDQ